MYQCFLSLVIIHSSRLRYLAYLETTGGPFCVTTVAKAVSWNTSEEENKGDYWDLCDYLDEARSTDPLFEFATGSDKTIYIFNSELGNCLLFGGSEGLAVLEMIYCNENWSIPWNGLAFEIKKENLVLNNSVNVGQFYVLQIMPDAFIGIEIGNIPELLLEIDPPP